MLALRHGIDEIGDCIKACKDAMKAAAKGGRQPLEDLPCSSEKECNVKLCGLNTLMAAAKVQGQKRKTRSEGGEEKQDRELFGPAGCELALVQFWGFSINVGTTDQLFGSTC